MTHQVALTIIAKIKQEKMEDLKQLLGSINKDIQGNKIIPFLQFDTIHFARFVILEESKDLDGNTLQPSLIFSSCIDAPLDKHFNQLVDVAGDGLDQIYDRCEGYPAVGDRTHQSRLNFLQAHQVKVQAFYVNTIGRTLQQIKQEAELRDKIEDFLDRQQAKSFSDWDAKEVHRAIQEFVKGESSLSWAQFLAARPNLLWQVKETLHFIFGLLLILTLSLLFLPFSPIFFIILRYKEEQDAQQDNLKLNTGKPRSELAIREDHVVQNQFSAVGYIKPGLFRQITVRVLLWLVNFASRHIFNNGNLAGVDALNLDGVDTIHFARWIVIDEGRRVLFMSNYDGSLESYMDDFINKVAWGLNAVFSNGVGYPKTRWLILDGAKDEQAFKAFIRQHQVVTQVWYPAYSQLTAVNLSNNAQIRAGLFKNLNQQQRLEWLRRL
ncbi:hypothetical protein WA1_24280 [Scytonema hofmannii PCC 7110]|uniref:Uncharacterized protein n=1 Tax=Scytonema hofmannii PCC 7110 TaxID=128403 RepID=A0A139X7S5_9CYAN|nr:hypothetical protein [Scytonema hofmannii]KYC40757.1 hypothetical protein WA1_24280 [Scytonema hofmannii PCC 7110]